MTKLIRGIEGLTSKHQGVVLTMGNFDGVHLGHQALLEKVTTCAKNLNVPSMVMTFEPLPAEYFSVEGKKVPRLMRLREKWAALKAAGIDYVCVVRFNEFFAAMSASSFVESILSERLNVKHIVVGDDFHFGAKRAGDFHFLKALSSSHGFSVEEMPTYRRGERRVSSTWVREALISGDLPLAEALLGRSYSMMGRVVHGDKRGRLLGFPTANINTHRSVTPVQGIFAVKMKDSKGRVYTGVANVGIRPTVGGTRTLLEVHLFDFEGDLYGEAVTVEFCHKQRDEERYSNLELLREQILKDAALARQYFEEHKAL